MASRKNNQNKRNKSTLMLGLYLLAGITTGQASDIASRSMPDVSPAPTDSNMPEVVDPVDFPSPSPGRMSLEPSLSKSASSSTEDPSLPPTLSPLFKESSTFPTKLSTEESIAPTFAPTFNETTSAPTATWTSTPTLVSPVPTRKATEVFSEQPSPSPTIRPGSQEPSPVPTRSSSSPTAAPTRAVLLSPAPSSISIRPSRRIESSPFSAKQQTEVPTEQPSPSPTLQLRPTTKAPSPVQTIRPTEAPTNEPSPPSTLWPTTKEPSPSPTRKPTEAPTRKPSPPPTETPTKQSSSSPTRRPTEEPTPSPTIEPTESTPFPTFLLTVAPSEKDNDTQDNSQVRNEDSLEQALGQEETRPPTPTSIRPDPSISPTKPPTESPTKAPTPLSEKSSPIRGVTPDPTILIPEEISAPTLDGENQRDGEVTLEPTHTTEVLPLSNNSSTPIAITYTILAAQNTSLSSYEFSLRYSMDIMAIRIARDVFSGENYVVGVERAFENPGQGRRQLQQEADSTTYPISIQLTLPTRIANVADVGFTATPMIAADGSFVGGRCPLSMGNPAVDRCEEVTTLVSLAFDRMSPPLQPELISYLQMLYQDGLHAAIVQNGSLGNLFLATYRGSDVQILSGLPAQSEDKTEADDSQEIVDEEEDDEDSAVSVEQQNTSRDTTSPLAPDHSIASSQIQGADGDGGRGSGMIGSLAAFLLLALVVATFAIYLVRRRLAERPSQLARGDSKFDPGVDAVSVAATGLEWGGVSNASADMPVVHLHEEDEPSVNSNDTGAHHSLGYSSVSSISTFQSYLFSLGQRNVSKEQELSLGRTSRLENKSNSHDGSVLLDDNRSQASMASTVATGQIIEGVLVVDSYILKDPGDVVDLDAMEMAVENGDWEALCETVSVLQRSVTSHHNSLSSLQGPSSETSTVGTAQVMQGARVVGIDDDASQLLTPSAHVEDLSALEDAILNGKWEALCRTTTRRKSGEMNTSQQTSRQLQDATNDEAAEKEKEGDEKPANMSDADWNPETSNSSSETMDDNV